MEYKEENIEQVNQDENVNVITNQSIKQESKEANPLDFFLTLNRQRQLTFVQVFDQQLCSILVHYLSAQDIFLVLGCLSKEYNLIVNKFKSYKHLWYSHFIAEFESNQGTKMMKKECSDMQVNPSYQDAECARIVATKTFQ